MSSFIKSRVGQAIVTAISVAVIWAICTPLFEILFRGGIKEWDAYKFVIEPIVIGMFVGIFEYVFQMSAKRKK